MELEVLGVSATHRSGSAAAIWGRFRRILETNRGSVLALMTGLLAQAILVGTGVIVARILGVQDRGHLAMLVLGPSLCANLASLGIPQAATFYIASNPASTQSVVKGSIQTLVVTSAAVGVLYALIVVVVVRGASSSLQTAGYLSVLAIPGSMAHALGLSILQGMQRHGVFNICRMGQLVPYAAGLAVLFVLGLDGIVLVTAIWASSVFIAGLVSLRTATASAAHGSEEAVVPKKSLVSFGLRSLPGYISPVQSLKLDQLFIGILVGPAALGLYVVANAFTTLPHFISQSIGIAAYPEIASRKDAASISKFVGLTLATCLVIIGSLMALAHWLVPFFFGSEFNDSIGLTRIVLIGAFFFALRRVLSDCARGLGHPGVGSIAQVYSLVLAAPIFVLLAHQWGVTGAAWAVVIGAAAGAFATAVLLAQAARRHEVRNQYVAGVGS